MIYPLMFISKKLSIKSFLIASNSFALITISPLNAQTDRELRRCISTNSPEAGCSRRCCGDDWDRCDKMMQSMFGRKCCLNNYVDIYDANGRFKGQERRLECPGGYNGKDVRGR